MTRIVHFTDATVAGANGIASSIRLLTGALAARGHECLVVSAGAAVGTRADGDVVWVPSTDAGMGDLRFALFPLHAMRGRVRAWRPEIAHVHTPGPLGAAGLTVARELGLPVVYTCHTDLHGYSAHYYIPTPIIRAGVAVYARHLRRAGPRWPVGKYAVIEEAHARVLAAADVIVAPTANALRRNRSAAAYAAKVRVIPTPPVVAPDGPSGAEFRARYGIAGDRDVVLFVGRLSAEKGLRLLLDAFRLVRAEAPAATLVLVGPRSRGLRPRRPADPDTVVTGTLNAADVGAAYRAATVIAFPSQTDTQGLVLHEAALAGVPAVLVDRHLHASHPLAGAMRLTDPTPAAFAAGICDLLADRGGRRLLGDRARALAGDLTPDRFAAETERAYRDAAGG